MGIHSSRRLYLALIPCTKETQKDERYWRLPGLRLWEHDTSDRWRGKLGPKRGRWAPCFPCFSELTAVQAHWVLCEADTHGSKSNESTWKQNFIGEPRAPRPRQGLTTPKRIKGAGWPISIAWYPLLSYCNTSACRSDKGTEMRGRTDASSVIDT